jgi:hypothetical protein
MAGQMLLRSNTFSIDLFDGLQMRSNENFNASIRKGYDQLLVDIEL